MKEQPAQPVNPLFIDLFEGLDEPEQFALVERAAIAEYDGGLSQDAAEKLAYELYRAGRLNIQ